MGFLDKEIAPNQSTHKFKVHFCVDGDMQIDGVDVVETTAPVVQWSTAIYLLAFTLQNSW